MSLFAVAQRFKHMLSPPTPKTGESALFVKSDGNLWIKDSSGIDRLVGENPTAPFGGNSLEEWKDGIPRGWHWFWKSDATLAEETGTSARGSKSAKITLDAVSGAYGKLNSPAWTTYGGASMTISFYARGTGTNPVAIIDLLSAPPGSDPNYVQPGAVASSSGAIPLTSNWTRYEVTLTAGPTCELARLFLGAESSTESACSVWFDQIGVVGGVLSEKNPPGSLLMYTSDIAPVGYLLCDGGLYLKSEYGSLYGVLGSSYSASATQFRTPDLRGRVPVGAGTWKALGKSDSTPETSRTLTHAHNAGGPTPPGSTWEVQELVGGRVVPRSGAFDGHSHNIGNATIPHLAVNFIIKT